MPQHPDLLARAHREGVRHNDRTGTGTPGLIGGPLHFELGGDSPS